MRLVFRVGQYKDQLKQATDNLWLWGAYNYTTVQTFEIRLDFFMFLKKSAFICLKIQYFEILLPFKIKFSI